MVAQGWRSPWGEVDGVYFKKGVLLILEVKAIKLDWLERPVSKSQGQRLGMIFDEVLERFPQYQVWMWLALVDARGEIQILPDYFGEY